MRGVGGGGDLFDGAAGLHALGVVADQALAVVAGVLVGVREEQPVLAVGVAGPVHADEGEAALTLLAVEAKLEVAALIAGLGVALGVPVTAVPDDHGAAAVLALRDRPLEFGVLDGVILDVDGEALIGGVEARTLGDRPAQQDAVELEAKVVMQARGGVLLNDKAQGSLVGDDLAGGFGGL